MTYAKPKFTVALTINCLRVARAIAIRNLSASLAPEQLIKQFESAVRTYNSPYGKQMSESDIIHAADMLYYMFIDSPICRTAIYADTISLEDFTLGIWTMLVASFPEFAECARIIGEHPRKEIPNEGLMMRYNQHHKDNPINLVTVMSITDTMRFLHCILEFRYFVKAKKFLYPQQVSKTNNCTIEATYDAGDYFKEAINNLYYMEAFYLFPPTKRWLNAWFPFRELWCFYDSKYRGRKYYREMPRISYYACKVC